MKCPKCQTEAAPGAQLCPRCGGEMPAEGGVNVSLRSANCAEFVGTLGDQGSGADQCRLGIRYGKGNGLPRDWGEAVKWYRKSAARGNEEAKNNLKRLGAN